MEEYPDYLQRLIDQTNDLREKIDDLSNFLRDPTSYEIGYARTRLLQEQYTHMQKYYDVLVERVDLEKTIHNARREGIK